MLPIFPEFKKLELSDKEDVEKFTLKYPPYSDFNFFGTLTWDVRDQMQISQLNGNYVIRFIDYLTGEPFYTFLGENDPNNTAEELLKRSIEEGLKPELKMVPEISIQGLDTNKFLVTENRDHFDYIYDLERIRDYKGKPFETNRNLVNRFLRNCHEIESKTVSIEDTLVQNTMIELCQKWIAKKDGKDVEFEAHEEFIVLKKLFWSTGKSDLVTTEIFVNKKLAGFCINEILESEYAVAHVSKADTSLPGIYQFLMQKNAEILYSMTKKFLNYEQDLGIPSLRRAKSSFRPCIFLKKYLVALK